MMIKSLILTLLCSFCLTTTHAQSYFRQCGVQLLTKQDGLSNNTLTGIHQDKAGFLWLGTDVGLSRYDGVHFHNYNLIEKEPRSLTHLYETSDNLLWSRITNLNQIACFDKMRGKYLPLTSPAPEVLQDILDICVLQDRLYALTSNAIVELNIEKNTDEIRLTAQPLTDIKAKVVKLYNNEDILCALTADNQILLYDIADKSCEYINGNDLGIAQADDIEKIHLYNNNVWICGQTQGIICYNTDTKTSRKLNDNSQPSLIQNSDIRDIIQIDEITFIIATWTSLAAIRFETDNYLQSPFRIIELTRYDSYYDPILKNRITGIHFDKPNNVLWVGTFGRGLLKLNFKGNEINRIPLNNEIRNVESIEQDANGCIWLATEKNGIYKSTEKSVSPYLRFSLWEKSNPGNHYCLHKDKNGELWFGDDQGSILRVNPTTGATVTYQPKPETADSDVTASILKLYLNSQNHLWIATEKGVMIYNHQTHECIASQPYAKEFKEVTAMCEDGDGTMWLGTEKGIRRADREGKRIKFTGGYEKERGLTPGKVLALYLNNYNQLFISYSDKIIQIDGKEKTVSSTMILQKELSNGHISCMIDDKNGNTWLGTNAGFITVNNKNNASYTYALPESYYDVCRLNDGKLLWANSTGLLYFEPRALKESSSNRRFRISDIDINYNKVEIGAEINGQVILDRPAHLAEHLSLDYHNNNLILYLSDLKYGTSPNTVKYRLLPTEKEWKTSYDDQIKLSDITPGKYMLEIRPSYPLDKDEQITRLSISVDRYWAASGWAAAVYILTIIFVSLLTWMYFNRKLQRRQAYKAKEIKLKEKLEEETEIRKEEEKNHQLRDQIRYMLAQELRTPLSLITAPLKEMIAHTGFPESFLQKARMAYRNSISLQDICNQLLNIHQQENYSPQLNVAPYPASAIADTVVRASYELLNVSPINLHYDKDNKINTEIWIDRKKIIFTLSNILSNAYRHISYSGSIRFTVNTSTINGKDFCLFTIEDDGKEMIEESSVIFLGSDNYNPPSNRLHPELGIEIMKKTALAHHGDIQITQEKNKGTLVVLYIPLGKQHLENNENVCFIEPETLVEDSDKAMITAEDKKQQKIASSIIANPIDSPETKLKLLVVEDHADIRLYLKVLFSSTYNIIMAENGEEGVKMARKEIPDLIITDIMMPVMNGFECCRILKEDLKTCHIPIILLTALTDDADIVKGIELGADDYILKPFNPEILRTKVKRLIKSRVELKQIYTKLLMPSVTDSSPQEENAETVTIEDPFITQILNIVNENLQNQEFNVKKLAEMLNMSQPTLYRKVKQLTNFTIIELVRGVRLKRSAELLRSRKHNVQEVAEMVGYNDIPTFRKHFVDFYGTTPSTFNNKEEAEDKK